MKKLLCTALFLSSLILNAQDNWPVSVSNGFGQGVNFDFVHSFKGRLYVGGDSTFVLASRHGNNHSSVNSYANPYPVRIFSSPDGLNFNQDTGFFNVANNGKYISSVASNNNFMFIGTSVGDTVKSPQVYRFDGTNYTMHDTIHYDATGYNIAPGVNGASIGALAFFSPGGVNDSIYAFVNSTNDQYEGMYYASVYKSSVNNPHWTNVARFSFGSGITDINSAKVWHKRLYITTTITDVSYNQYSSILSTADGSHWDTLTRITPFLANAGLASGQGYIFGQLEIHHDTLMVGIGGNNNIGIPVWYTTDSLNINPTWHGYVGTNTADSTMASQWSYGVGSLKSFNNQLWMTSSTYPRQDVYSYDKHKGLRLSSNNATLEMVSNGNFLLESFNNKIYMAGTTTSAGVLTNGNLSYLGIPMANFTDSAAYGFCTNNSVQIYNSSVNATFYKWFKNDTLIYAGSSADPGIQSFTNPGTYTYTVLAYSSPDTTSLVDSITKQITIYNPPTIGLFSASSYTVCQGQPDTLTASATGGLAPYTYQWNAYDPSSGPYFGSTAVVTLTGVTVTSFSPTIIDLQVKDARGCVVFGGNGLHIVVNQSDSLSGFVKRGSSFITKGQVYLFKEKNTHVGVGDSTDVYSLTSSPLSPGYFTFPNLYYGNYIVKAVADTAPSAYPLTVGTYYTNPIDSNAYQWDSATVILHHGCAATNDVRSIHVISIIPQTGTGFISGIIVKDTSFGQRWNTGGFNSVMGSPLKGADVKLGKSPGGGCSARTTSGTTAGQSPGYFQFTNVDTGMYRIFVDIPNYGMDSVRLVHITNLDTISLNNNYHVDSTKIYIDRSVTAGIFTQGKSNDAGIKVYPNPAANVAYLDFSNKTSALVSAQLYDLSGKQLAVIANQKMPQGNQSIKINLAELQLPAGVYFIRATINNALQTFKLTVIAN